MQNISVKYRETCGISPEDEDVTVGDPEGRTWSVGLFHRRSRSSKGGDYIWMTKGWLKFARANGLQVGDRCKFELVQERGKKKLYLVRILRYTCEWTQSVRLHWVFTFCLFSNWCSCNRYYCKWSCNIRNYCNLLCLECEHQVVTRVANIFKF